jgi:hypothetical protein
VPGWAVLAAAMAVLAVLGTLNALADRRDRLRAAEAADHIDVRLTSGGLGTTYDDGVLGVSLVIDNRGPARRFGLPSVEPAHLELLDPRPPDPVPERGDGYYTMRLLPVCDQVPDGRSPGPLRVHLPVIPASGRVHVVSVEPRGTLIGDLVMRACGLAGPSQAARPAFAGPTSTSAAGVSFVLLVHNPSQQGFAVTGLGAPGLRLRTSEQLPVPVLPGRTAELHVTLSVASCALVATRRSEQQPGSLPAGTLELELSSVSRPAEYSRLTISSAEPLHDQWRSYLVRRCPPR